MIRMAIQVVLIDEAGGGREVHEIVRIDRGQLCPEALGLSLTEAKAITGGIQQVLAGAQVIEWQEDQRACPGVRAQPLEIFDCNSRLVFSPSRSR